MTKATFNLCSQPWITVRFVDGEMRDVSLREVFARAHEIQRVSGDGPTQDVAITRLLLALLMRTLPVVDDPVDEWKRLKDRPTLPLEGINRYLDAWEYRFDLFDADFPFMQVPHDVESKSSGLYKLVPDLPDSPDKQLFTNRAGGGASSLSFAEAARWLVHTQAFDPSGIKTGLHGDSRVKGGKGYPIGVAWTGNLGVLMVQGRTLKETLVLNAVLDRLSEQDIPPWELEPDGPDVRRTAEGAVALPVGMIQALTWQSRRMVLHLNSMNTAVENVTIGNGNPISPENRWTFEPFTAWRYSVNKSKASSDIYFPLTVNPDRAMWRGLAVFLGVPSQQGAMQSKAAKTRKPGVVEWLECLAGEEIISSASQVTVSMTGAVYGTQNSVIDTVVADSLSFPMAVMTNAQLQGRALQAIETADSCVWVLRGLARDLGAAAGVEALTERVDSIERRAYAELGSAYRRWLTTLTPDVDRDEVAYVWQKQVKRIIDALAAELIRDAGQTAIVGRDVVDQRSDHAEHLDAGSASLKYQALLARRLELLQERKASTPVPAPSQIGGHK